MSVPIAIFPSNSADADIERRVLAYLASRDRLSFRRLSVESRDGIVTLTGQLGTYYEKQVAQETVRRVAGVLRVIDEVQVGSRTSAIEGAAPVPKFAALSRRVELAEGVLCTAD
jgi:BON domain